MASRPLRAYEVLLSPWAANSRGGERNLCLVSFKGGFVEKKYSTKYPSCSRTFLFHIRPKDRRWGPTSDAFSTHARWFSPGRSPTLRPSQKLFLGNNCSVVTVHQKKISSRKLGSNCRVFLLSGAPNSALFKLSQTHGSHLSLRRKAGKSVPGPLESRGRYSEAVSGILEAMSERGTRQPPPFPHVQEAGPKELCTHTCELNKSQSCHHYVTQNKTIHSFSGRDALKLPQHMCVGSGASAAAGGAREKPRALVAGRQAACGWRVQLPAGVWATTSLFLVCQGVCFLMARTLSCPLNVSGHRWMQPLVSLKAPRQPPPQSPRAPSVQRLADELTALFGPVGLLLCFWPS